MLSSLVDRSIGLQPNAPRLEGQRPLFQTAPRPVWRAAMASGDRDGVALPAPQRMPPCYCEERIFARFRFAAKLRPDVV
jgi:hypothetical protein